MKKTSKKLLSFLLAFGMILSMFAVTSAAGWAADEHVPASATLVAYPKPATESLASLSSKVSGLKSSNKAVVTVKLSKYPPTALHRHTIRFWQSQRKPVQPLFLLNVREKHIK